MEGIEIMTRAMTILTRKKPVSRLYHLRPEGGLTGNPDSSIVYLHFKTRMGKMAQS
jgi:hypothetical protein